MNNIPTKGYDPLVNYSVDELKRMYIQEGLTATEALKRAKRVGRAINTLNIKEQRLWDKVRENETPVGSAIEMFD